MDIYIIECDSCLEKGRRTQFYILGEDNAYAEYESAFESGENPVLYNTDIAPTGLIMRGEKIK